jgi:hypothetical protein
MRVDLVRMDHFRHAPRFYAAILIALASFAFLALFAPRSEAAPARGVSLHPNWYWSAPHGASEADLSREIDVTESMNADVARLVLPWNMLEPNGPGIGNTYLRNRIDTAAARFASRDIKMVLTVVGTPCWASSDPVSCQPGDAQHSLAPAADPTVFGGAVRRFIDRWGSSAAAVEVWNEPYIDGGFKGTPAEYAGLVNATNASLETSTWPGRILAMAAAPGQPPYGWDWLEEIYDAGMHGHDAISIHPYDFEWTSTSFSFTDPRTQGSRFAAQIDAVRTEMRARGEASKGMWLTEIGMAVCPAPPGCVSPQEQAEWLTAMFAEAERRPFIEGTLVYALRDQAEVHTEWGQRWGLLNHDFSERPAAASLRAAFSVPPVETDPTARTMAVETTTGGSVSAVPPVIDCDASCTAQVDDGTKVTLTAKPAAGYAFAAWTGCDSTDGSQCSVRIAGDEGVSASFVEIQTLTVTASGGGSVAGADAGIDCGSACMSKLTDGRTVTLTATPASGYALKGWSGCDSVSGTTCTMTMEADRTATATFAVQRTLRVTKTGSGTVTGPPGTLNCGSTCATTLNEGTMVVLTASPAAGYEFSGWSGCDQVVGDKCAVWLVPDRSVGATFVPLPKLTVDNPVGGRVTADAGGIDCGSACSAWFDKGTTVTLTATTAPGFKFLGWSGCDSVSGVSCTVVLTSDRAPRPTFAPVGTVTVQTQGAGTVTSSAAGISCGSSCAATVDDGTIVTLTATAAAGHTFAGWEDCDEVSGDKCAVRVVDDRSPRATFTPDAPVRIATPLAPDARIDTLKVRRRTVAVALASSGGTGALNYACKLDSGAFKPCASAATFRATGGRHTLQVTVTDERGATDMTAATRKFAIKKR